MPAEKVSEEGELLENAVESEKLVDSNLDRQEDIEAWGGAGIKWKNRHDVWR